MLKEHYSQYTSEYLHERRALGEELSKEAHSAIDSILLERGESLVPPVGQSALESSSDGEPFQKVKEWAGRLDRFLVTSTPPLWRYCVIAAPLALLPSIAILTIATLLSKLIGLTPRFPSHPAMSASWAFVMVIATPVLETVVLAALLWILARFVRARRRLAGASAILWGLLHATAAPIWFFGTAWSFFVFSSAYIAWRERSRTHAFVAAAVPHGLVNLAAVAMMRASV